MSNQVGCFTMRGTVLVDDTYFDVVRKDDALALVFYNNTIIPLRHDGETLYVLDSPVCLLPSGDKTVIYVELLGIMSDRHIRAVLRAGYKDIDIFADLCGSIVIQEMSYTFSYTSVINFLANHGFEKLHFVTWTNGDCTASEDFDFEYRSGMYIVKFSNGLQLPILDHDGVSIGGIPFIENALFFAVRTDVAHDDFVTFSLFIGRRAIVKRFSGMRLSKDGLQYKDRCVSGTYLVKQLVLCGR